MLVVVEGLSDRLARCNLSPSAADVRVAGHSAGVELNVVLVGWFEYFFQRAFSSCRRKWMPHFADPALMWKVLAVATTFAGNLRSSVRLEHDRRRDLRGTSANRLWDYARFRIPITM